MIGALSKQTAYR